MLLEGAEQPAEITAVQVERFSNLARGGPIAMRELVQHARFGQREGRAEVSAEGSDAAGVEAVEFPDCFGSLVDVRHGSRPKEADT